MQSLNLKKKEKVVGLKTLKGKPTQKGSGKKLGF